MMPADELSATSVRQRVGARLRPGIGDVWRWWTQALASWLPQRLRTLFGLMQERLLLQSDGDSLRLALDREGGMHEIGRVPWSTDAAVDTDTLSRLLTQRLAELPRWLLLPAACGLRRQMVLPAAAADRLRDVLAFEVDRQTPFAANDVHFDARMTGRRADGQLQAELVVVPKATFDAAVAGLGPLADTLAGADMAAGDGRPLGINLLAGAQRHQRTDPWRGWHWALGAFAALAVAAGLWQMLGNREAAAEGFEREVAQRAQQARGVAVDKRQLTDLVEGMGFLQRTRAGRPTMVEVLDEVTRRLPDSTYLEKLSVESDRLMVIGLSTEASALVGRLEGSPLWRAPALTGALMPDPRSGRDRFTLTADLVVADANKEDADARRQP